MFRFNLPIIGILAIAGVAVAKNPPPAETMAVFDVLKAQGKLVIDPKTETFGDDKEANALRGRPEYRKPWVLPEVE